MGASLLTLLFLLTFFPQAASAADLGIGVKPIPKYDDSDKAGLANNSRLWFIVEPGSSSSREILLIGSAVEQRVKMEIVSALETDGELTPTTEESSISQFFKFSDNNFVLDANQNKVIKIEMNVPLQTPSQSANAFLVVSVVGDSSTSYKGKKGSQIQALVKNQIRTATRMFIGIGSYEDFYTDFEIKEVKDYSIRGRKFLDLYIENIGKTPITPQGDVTFASLDFSGVRFGPFSYLTLSIEPGEVGRFKLRVSDEIVPGNWQVLVKARQGDILRTKIFEKNLKFREGLDWINIVLRVGAILLSLFLFYYLRRNLSISRKEKEIRRDQQVRLKMARLKKFFKARRNHKEQKDDYAEFSNSFSYLLDELDVIGTAKKSTAKKSTAKKSTAKKSTAKKSTAKKSTAKKRR